MEPKISVIIPIYNTGHSAVELIKNLLKNPYKNLEIIVIDDGSTDDSYANIKNIKEKNIRIFHKSNGGASSARNLGLTKATGEYISFLDSDDEISPKFFTLMVEPLVKDPTIAFSVCGFRYKRLKQGTVKDAYTNMLESRRAKESFKCYILRLLAIDGRLYSSVNKLYRADIIKKIHLKFDETLNFAEDTKFVLDYLAAAEKLSAEITPLPDHNSNPNLTSAKPSLHPSIDICFVLEPLYIYNYGTSTSTVATSSLDWKNWQISFCNLQAWLGPHPSAPEKSLLTHIHHRWRISHALAVARSNKSFREKSQYLNPLLLSSFLLLAKLRK